MKQKSKQSKKAAEQTPNPKVLLIAIVVVLLLFVVIFVFGKSPAHAPTEDDSHAEESHEAEDGTLVEEYTEETESKVESVEERH